MDIQLLDALSHADNLPYYCQLNKDYFNFISGIDQIIELAIFLYTGDQFDPWKFFSLNGTTEESIRCFCDFSTKDLPEQPSDLLILDNNKKIFISSFIHDTSRLADLVLLVKDSGPSKDMEWQFFADIIAKKICSKFTFPSHVSDYYLHESEKMLNFIRDTQTHESEKMLNFMRDIQAVLSTERTSEPSLPAIEPGYEKIFADLWHKEDTKIANRFLIKLQQTFNLHSIFIMQNAAPGYINIFTRTRTTGKTLEEINNLTQAILNEHFSDELTTRESIELSQSNKFIGEQIFPLAVPCQAGGKTIGFLGLFTGKKTHRHLNHRSKFLLMLTNQLGFYFSHFYQLRKKALYNRVLQQINLTCNIINTSVDIGAILYQLAESLNYLFGQYSGAVAVFSQESNELEIVNYLGTSLPEGLTEQDLVTGPVLEIIKEGSGYDSTKQATLKLPIRYILSLASSQIPFLDGSFTPLRPLGGVILFESPDNKKLTREDLHSLMPILLNGIGASLKVACNYAEKLETINALEGLMQWDSDKDTLRDKIDLLLDKMVLIIRKILKVNRISYLSMTEDKKHLFIQKSFGLPNGIKEKTLIPLGEEISGYVALQGRSYRIDDIETRGVFKKRSQEHYFNRSLLSVPLLKNASDPKPEVIGVINVNNKINGLTFTDQDQKLLEALANFVVKAIMSVEQAQKKQEEELLARERKDAHDIQMSLLPHPKSFSKLPNTLDVHGLSIPARQIGGDFFDLITLENGKIIAVLGDVSGKGMPAAILMAMTRMIIRSAITSDSNLIEVLDYVNKHLSNDLDPYRFVTLQLVLIDPATGESEMTSAGHGALMAKINNEIQMIETSKGLPLGIMVMPDAYTVVKFKLNPGDCIFMYTDGVSEEHSPDKQMFGNQRIEELMKNNQIENAESFSNLIVGELQKWRETKEAHDDITVLTIKYKGPQA